MYRQWYHLEEIYSMVWNSIRELFQLIYDSTTTWRKLYGRHVHVKSRKKKKEKNCEEKESENKIERRSEHETQTREESGKIVDDALYAKATSHMLLSFKRHP